MKYLYKNFQDEKNTSRRKTKNLSNYKYDK